MTSSDGVLLVRRISAELPPEAPEVVVFPTALAAAAVAAELSDSTISVGVQNIYERDKGAFTGEVSAALAKAEGIAWALVGHSERRTIFGETDAMLARKMMTALENGLKVIFCVGETLQEREAGITNEVLARQLVEGYLAAAPGGHPDTVIAYEPVWAIGTGRTATPEIAQEAHAFIRRLLCERVSDEVANSTRVLYGGSVTASNIKGLMAKPDINGALVGGASLKADEFLRIIRYKE